MRVMLYNGSVYYITIIGVNVLNVVLQAVPNIYLLPDADVAASVTIPLTTVLISRFILDLQQAAGRTAATPSAPSQVTSLDFATMEHGSSATSRGPGTLAAFITSMGTDVHMGLYDDEGGTEDVWPRGHGDRHGDRDEIAMVDMRVGLERDRNA
uniref:Zn(2)-C6 fungal-type domain-containing protein n=1 Tax=Ganoderma boninense TaxID=34458 RepID=A0A5K1JZ36_9APHY|nr:Zn(2)-C6 fungal-type domain-containing protein [Ganoderma boninense]